MAYFWMWMACFFTSTIFWKCLGSWSTRKNKDFLQVQREYCKRLGYVIPRFEDCLKDMKASPRKYVLNKNQCAHLLDKFILAMKGIDKMLSIASQDFKFQFIFEELCYLKNKIEIVRNNCIEQERWCHSAVYQLQNKETFRELLEDLKYCYNAAREVYLLHHPNQYNDILPIQFDATTYEQVLEDGQELKKKLEFAVYDEISEDYEIAEHLLLKLRNLERVDGGDLDALEVPNDFKTPKLIKKIGEGSYGDVFKSNWMGFECATKVLRCNLEYYTRSFRKEVGIMASLSHPNLVQFFGCGITQKVGDNFMEDEIGVIFQILKNLIKFFGFGITKRIDENPIEDEFGEMHLIMELMDSNLSILLGDLKKTKRPLSYHVAIDIMHQIAKGVYYLHDMQVAHLDLKPANVLYSSIPMSEGLDSHRIFKITDYGTSQLEVCSNPKNPKPLKCPIGTFGYMAPEVTKGSKIPLYPFQADVWSFAMICSEILSGKVPYSGLKRKEFLDQIQGTHDTTNKILRPDLPNNCEELTNLIQECWSQDPLQRPTFSNIYERLTDLKKYFLKGTYSCKLVPQYGLPCTLRDSKSTVDHVPKVDEPNGPRKEILVDLDHQLSKAKRLLKLKYIGIIGMGGIGKTTLAKAIFDDRTVNSSYHASCFVAQCKNFQNSYEILCEVLSQLWKDQKPKNFRDAKVMMMELFIRKKVLLILDDIKDESQVHDVVPPNFIQESKDSTIIITTRQWSTIKSFVGNEGRLDVELLNGKAAIKLFTTHLRWDEASLSPDFVALCKHVVEACNGLPLSLKVMGAFLRNKERLRSWEQALQRMARGKDLDGDEEIWNTMQISFDGLKDGVEKMMFLDVACFFCRDVYPSGISKETILSMWSKDGILPVVELERLMDMSLLKVNGDGDILEMHDHVRDMGRMLAKDTRIWRTSMIPESGFSSKDIEVLEGISLQGIANHHVPLFESNPSFDFKKLRVLILVSAMDNPEADIANLYLLLEIASQSSQLEAIIIGNSQNLIKLPHTLPTSIATTLSMKILDLCTSCASLKILDLIGLEFLKLMPNKFLSRNTLLRLNLSSCSKLVTLPKEVGNLSSLSTLNLEDCSSLESLPKEVGNLSSLSTFYLSFCSSLIALPKELGNLTSLTTLHLSFCLKLTALPDEVGNLSYLTTLYLRGCSRLEALSKEVGNLSSLIILDLSGCSSLKALPNEVGNLSSLTTLDLRRCSNLVTLPKEVGNLSSLTILNMEGCSSLVALPKEVGNLSSLTTLNLRRCSNLVALPKEVGNLSSLTTLYLLGCSSLVALPYEVENFSFLTTLDLGCSSLVALPKGVGNLSSLTTLNLDGCSSLAYLPKEVKNLFSLSTLSLSFCSSLIALPKEVGNLSSLITLDLRGCSNLVTLPKEVGNLSSLTTLNLDGCSSLVLLPQEVGNLSSLTTLDLRRCSSLVALPQGVGNLSFLTTLDLRGCSSLVALPKEVGNLSSLISFDLSGCSSLAGLPKEVGNLSSLITLDLRGSLSLKALPKEVGILTNLDLDGCSHLAVLSEDAENLSHLAPPNLDVCSNLVTLPKEVEISSSLTTLNSKEYPSKTQVQTTRDDKHVIKKQQPGTVISQFKAKYDLSESFNDIIQEILSKLGSLLLWIQIHTSISGQQVLSWKKGKVESKDLITRRFLGQGCFGIFYETTWLEKCIVTFARKDFPGVTGDTFTMEAIHLFELRDHPNIVKTFCWTVDNRSCSLVMEYVKDDLSSFMRKKKEALRKQGDESVIGANPSPFQLLEALDILLQIVVGMEYLHDEGIYHGDLKPNNVFLDWKEDRMLVKVSDFGLLKTKRNSTLLSQRALCFQMIEWSAPELFEDYFTSMSEDLDFLLDPSTSGATSSQSGPKVMMEKADSYSFGLTSAYVLGGEQMWPAHLNPQELRKHISHYGLRPKLPLECPKTLKSLINACWNPDPTCRPTFSIIRNMMQDIIKEQLEVSGSL